MPLKSVIFAIATLLGVVSLPGLAAETNPRFWEIPAQSVTAPETIPLMPSSGQRIALESTTVRDRLNSSSETLNNNRYYNRHTFEGKAGEQITIELTSDQFDPYLILIDPDGNRIAKDDDSGEGKNARITVTLPTTGTYVILANSYNKRETGNYTLSWRAATPSELLQAKADQVFQQGIEQYKTSQFQAAIESWQEELGIYRQLENRQGEARSLNNLGFAYRRLEQYRKAIEFHQQSLSLAKELEDLPGEARSLNNLGLAYRRLGQSRKAIEFYKQAIKVKESIQGDIKVEELKTSYANQQVNTYENLINLLWNQKDFEAAFNYVERARAKAFLDQLANEKIDFRAGADSKLLEQEQDLKDQINALSQELITLRNGPKNQWDNDRIAETENNRTALRKDYQDLLVQLKIQSPEIASLISVEVASLPEIQGLLDADTTLVEYFVTDERTLAFIITRNSFKTVPLNVTRQQLTEELTLFQDFADLDEPHPLELKNLHDWLIVPLQAHLNTTTISIVPHSILHYLPFAALTDGQQYLSDNYALLSLPSASILRYLPDKGKSTTGSLLALGDPTIPGLSPLTHAQKEVETIANLFKTKALVGKAATESALRSRAKQSGIIHLAVHGEYNQNNPLFSAIRLLEDTQHDGSLEVHEVYGLDLTSTTNLVVLSACQTKIGELSRGDEVVGLTRAFLYAGTPTIIASLWNVDDRATGLLMKQFYSHWQQGMNKAEALQQAQKDLRETYPHPYFWAAFSLTGDAGNRE